MTSEYEEARGINLGPASYEEVIDYLSDASPRQLIVTVDRRHALDNPSDEPARIIGYGEHLHVADDDGERDALIVYSGETVLGNGAIFDDVRFAMWLSAELPPEAERFTGGVRLTTRAGVIIEIVTWHDVLHLTESGDVAPGLGPFTV